VDDDAAALTRTWRGARREDATRDPVGHASRSEEGAACMVVLSISDWLRRNECMSTWRAPGSHSIPQSAPPTAAENTLTQSVEGGAEEHVSCRVAPPPGEEHEG